MNGVRSIIGLCVVWVACLAAPLVAQPLPPAYQQVADHYQVPANILFAMALTESGRRYRGKWLPWPWALNIAGRSVYCASWQAARDRIHQALQHHQAVDIGLMQISWRWHRQRFGSIEASLLPINNLMAGAAILREQYQYTGDWWEAVGRYHDPGQDAVSLESAERYRQRVKQNWRGEF